MSPCWSVGRLRCSAPFPMGHLGTSSASSQTLPPLPELETICRLNGCYFVIDTIKARALELAVGDGCGKVKFPNFLPEGSANQFHRPPDSKPKAPTGSTPHETSDERQPVEIPVCVTLRAWSNKLKKLECAQVFKCPPPE